MRQYSIDNVEVGWLGLDFKEGLAQGTSITVTKTTVAFTQKPRGIGGTTRVYNPDRSGTVTFLIDQESQLHQSLKGLANSERTPSGRDKVGEMAIRDLTSGEILKLKNAFITAIPDYVRGTESQVFSWVFGFEDFEDEEVTTLSNVVGD